jgi:hypothetical protein
MKSSGTIVFNLKLILSLNQENNMIQQTWPYEFLGRGISQDFLKKRGAWRNTANQTLH